ncbi:cutinase family protein [Corynebacterium bovis]|uniref:cutinase family protein n=1 Tax=Corynebacterium bovis TaxID=36808 RepID=UPI0031395634
MHLVFVNGTLDSNPSFDPNRDQGFFGQVFDKINRKVNEGLISDLSGGVAADASAVESARVTATPSPLASTSESDATAAAVTTAASVAAEGEPASSASAGVGRGGLRISRSYVNYPATAGGAFFPGVAQANPGSTTAYIDSMNTGVERAIGQIESVAHRCPDTKIGLMGYSQGAEVVSNVTKRIGAGQGPVPAERLALSALFFAPTRAAATPTQVLGYDSVGTGKVKEVTTGLSDYPVADGGGISFGKTGITDYGAASDRVVSWCLNGDLVCGLPVDSTTARTLVGIAEDVSVGDPVGTMKRLADGLGQALSVSDVDTIDAAAVDFGEGGFTLTAVDNNATGARSSGGLSSASTSVSPSTTSRAASSGARSATGAGARQYGDGGEMIGRFISSAKHTSSDLEHAASRSGSSTIGLPGIGDLSTAGGAVADMADQAGDAVAGIKQGLSGRGNVAPGTTIEDRLVPAMADLGGMALGATITTVKKTLSPENLAAVGAAGAAGGVQAAGAVALAKFSEAGLSLLKPDNASMFSRRALESLEKSGLGTADIAKLAVDLSNWKSLNEHVSYDKRPVMADGRTAVEASVDWAVATAEEAGGFTVQDDQDTSGAGGALGEAVAPVGFDSESAWNALGGLTIAGARQTRTTGSSGTSARPTHAGSATTSSGMASASTEPTSIGGEE